MGTPRSLHGADRADVGVSARAAPRRPPGPTDLPARARASRWISARCRRADETGAPVPRIDPGFPAVPAAALGWVDQHQVDEPVGLRVWRRVEAGIVLDLPRPVAPVGQAEQAVTLTPDQALPGRSRWPRRHRARSHGRARRWRTIRWGPAGPRPRRGHPIAEPADARGDIRDEWASFGRGLMPTKAKTEGSPITPPEALCRLRRIISRASSVMTVDPLPRP